MSCLHDLQNSAELGLALASHTLSPSPMRSERGGGLNPPGGGGHRRPSIFALCFVVRVFPRGVDDLRGNNDKILILGCPGGHFGGFLGLGSNLDAIFGWGKNG